MDLHVLGQQLANIARIKNTFINSRISFLPDQHVNAEFL